MFPKQFTFGKTAAEVCEFTLTTPRNNNHKRGGH